MIPCVGQCGRLVGEMDAAQQLTLESVGKRVRVWLCADCQGLLGFSDDEMLGTAVAGIHSAFGQAVAGGMMREEG